MSRLGRVDGVEVSGVSALALALHAPAVVNLDGVALDGRDAIAALVELDVYAGLGVEPATGHACGGYSWRRSVRVIRRNTCRGRWG